MSKDTKKTAAKRAGVKSALVVNDKVYITAFGKGNKGILEYQITPENDVVKLPVSNSSSITVNSANDNIFEVTTSRSDLKDLEAKPSNPTKKSKSSDKSPRQDMLGLKSALEKEYFGKEFNDNIHIQIIHCIQDIEKILAVYSTNANYALVNLLGHNFKDESGKREDFLGSDAFKIEMSYESFSAPANETKLSSEKERTRENEEKRLKYLEDFNNMTDPDNYDKRLGYFGEAFFKPSKSRGKDTVADTLKSREEIYNIISVVSSIRTWCVHYNESSKGIIFKYDSSDTKKVNESLQNTLDTIIHDRFEAVNNKFVKTNFVDLSILNEVLSKTFPKFKSGSHAQKYYGFIIFKSHKNLGFSIKELRKKLFDIEDAKAFSEKQYDSVRFKMNKLIDFFITYHYTTIDKKQADKLVSKLRYSIDEKEKDDIYTTEAEDLWNKYKSSFEQIRAYVSPDIITEYEHQATDFEYEIKKSDPSTELKTFFSKMIYVLCMFLDGKEINELLSTLINKFDNIDSFITTSDGITDECRFTGTGEKKNIYDILNSSGSIVRELKFIKSLARMQKPSASVKVSMIMSSLALFGVDPANLYEYVLTEIMKIDENGKSFSNDHALRNFIVNNVISSSRFTYIIKFVNANIAYNLGHNKKAVSFVIKRLPTQQIDRYYISCIGKDARNAEPSEKEQALIDMITSLRYDHFTDVNNENTSKKEKYKAIIGLYLTVVYQLVKNIVNINSRYVIAFHCLERDAYYNGAIYNGKYYSAIRIPNEPDDTDVSSLEYGGAYYYAYTSAMLHQGTESRSHYIAVNKHYRECVQQDLLNARNLHTPDYEVDAIREFRNAVAHLDIVRNIDEYIEGIANIDSYYALYHYLAQRCIQKRCRDTIIGQNEYFTDLDKYKTYVKDFVKALCVPFAYNAPRFKNLTIQGLFDKNEESSETSACSDKEN